MLTEDVAIDLVSAKSLGSYRLELVFSDRIKRVIDFGSFLRKSNHPDIKKYLDPQLFESFTIEGGDLVWNDYELCFPFCDLYEGKID